MSKLKEFFSDKKKDKTRFYKISIMSDMKTYLRTYTFKVGDEIVKVSNKIIGKRGNGNRK